MLDKHGCCAKFFCRPYGPEFFHQQGFVPVGFVTDVFLLFVPLGHGFNRCGKMFGIFTEGIHEFVDPLLAGLQALDKQTGFGFHNGTPVWRAI